MHDSGENRALVRRHLRFGWWCLLIFLTLGIVLEAMHGFKVAWYMSVANETRRLMWRLAHAHGTFLSLVHIAFAWTLSWSAAWRPARGTIASRCLIGATIAMPAGFLLGGFITYGGDPGLGIVLLPVGALLLLVAVLINAIELSRLRE